MPKSYFEQSGLSWRDFELQERQLGHGAPVRHDPASWDQSSWAYRNLTGENLAPIAFPTAPAITFATPGDLAVTYTTQTGYYRRWGIHCLVSIEIETATFTHTTASGAMRVTNLPFTIAMDTIGTVSWQGVTKANYTQMVAKANSGNTFCTINASGSGQNINAISAGDMPTGGTVILRISLLYDV